MKTLFCILIVLSVSPVFFASNDNQTKEKENTSGVPMPLMLMQKDYNISSVSIKEKFLLLNKEEINSEKEAPVKMQNESFKILDCDDEGSKYISEEQIHILLAYSHANNLRHSFPNDSTLRHTDGDSKFTT